MGFLDKVKENIQETATMAREGVEDLHTKHELGQAYGELGRKTFDLIDAGTLQAPELGSDVERYESSRQTSQQSNRRQATPPRAETQRRARRYASSAEGCGGGGSSRRWLSTIAAATSTSLRPLCCEWVRSMS